MRKDIFFAPGQKARILAALQEFEYVDRGELDPEYLTAFYVLSSDDGIWEYAQPFISKSGIRFPAMLKGKLSSGESIMVKLAANLFNQASHTRKVDPADLIWLDDRNFAVAMSALALRRDASLHTWHVADLVDDQGEQAEQSDYKPGARFIGRKFWDDALN